MNNPATGTYPAVETPFLWAQWRRLQQRAEGLHADTQEVFLKAAAPKAFSNMDLLRILAWVSNGKQGGAFPTIRRDRRSRLPKYSRENWVDDEGYEVIDWDAIDAINQDESIDPDELVAAIVECLKL